MPPVASKQALLAERERLVIAGFDNALTPAQAARLAEIEAQLESIETIEADLFDEQYAASRAGRIEAALDRLEASLQPRPPRS